VFLTEYIERGDLAGARDASRVTDPLPGVTVSDSYAGYITVDPAINGNTFFWFFPATVRFMRQCWFMDWNNDLFAGGRPC